jgi:RimJ/RimL family protein N-acetyltransferase
MNEKTPHITPTFEHIIKKEVRNFKTGEICHMEGGLEMTFSDEDVQAITRICSQDEVYDMIFSRRMAGKPYTEEKARSFISRLQAGWRDQTLFTFIVRNSNNEIIGSIDIKSPDLDGAEIGYWSDKNSSGFMTNALNELMFVAAQAGYRTLHAKVLTHNTKSANLLERVGFVKRGEMVMMDGLEYNEFDKTM